jgi:acrylyl-CoA reductase (NADPH)
VTCPIDRRMIAWPRLARDVPAEKLAAMTRIAPLTEVPSLVDSILKGQVQGRTVIDVNA